jgi:hypothetical protein
MIAVKNQKIPAEDLLTNQAIQVVPANDKQECISRGAVRYQISRDVSEGELGAVRVLSRRPGWCVFMNVLNRQGC